jgi:bifunctional ADP-heptose synthase (sugar kinase/adenylyltransferase)
MASNVHQNFRSLGADVHLETAFLENKNRYIDQKSNQQVLRVDERISNVSFDPNVIPHLSRFDCIVFSDYDKGFLKYQDITDMRRKYDGPIFIDTKKKNLGNIGDCIVKINQHEYKSLTSYPLSENLIVTLGGENVTWNNRIYFPPKVDVHDVCGAGDTFLAALVFEYMRKDKDMERAIPFAMKAAAITVQNIGVYAPTLEEIEYDKT